MKYKWIHHEWIFILALLFLFGCYSNKNKTEERAKVRVIMFINLMVKDKIDEAEKMLSTDMVDSGNMEFFLASFDDPRLKDTTDVKVQIDEVYIPKNDKKNRAKVGMTIRSDKNECSKIASIIIKYEKGDWYIGGA